MKKIKGALISVYYKDGLDKIVNLLAAYGVRIYSTGGTLDFIKGLGHEAESVENLTSYPSILGGRVKTLHPKVFGGILGRRGNNEDLVQMAQYGIPEIDMVIVDLYPFEETAAGGGTHEDVIEKIDIGGISLIRAAAKNYKDVLIVSSREQYGEVLGLLENQGCATTLDDRQRFAALAFRTSSHYDSEIFKYFNEKEGIDAFRVSHNKAKHLRYGENPHQKAVYYGDLDGILEQTHGKDISYNNMLDVEAAINLIAEFADPTFVVIKHNNACGVATRASLLEAWTAALACDPVSAYGGVLICNREMDAATAAEMNNLFFEVIIAPAYSEEAVRILSSKKNRIILILKKQDLPEKVYRSILGGVAVQDRDSIVGGQDTPLEIVTQGSLTEQQRADLIFANKIVKHSKSNAIVFARDNTLLASGIGQTSRVDALKQAIEKAKSFGFVLRGGVMASDAFFPFSDCVELAHKEGVDAVVQPGGSIRDQDSIDYSNANGVVMAFTGTRHFKH